MIIGSISTVGGAVIGAIIAYFFAVHLHKGQRTFAAGIALRSAFAEELHSLKRNPGHDAGNLLQAAFKKHSLAVAEFAIYLNRHEALNFEIAWIAYYGTDQMTLDDDVECELPREVLEDPFLQKYSKKGVNVAKAKERRERAISNIESLLAFSRSPNRKSNELLN